MATTLCASCTSSNPYPQRVSSFPCRRHRDVPASVVTVTLMQNWETVVGCAIFLALFGLSYLIKSRRTSAEWDYEIMVATGAGAHRSAPRPDWDAHPTEPVFKHLPPEIAKAGYWTREEEMFNCEAWCARVPGNISDLLPLRAHASRFDMDEHTLYAEFSVAPPGYQPISWGGDEFAPPIVRLWASAASGSLRGVMSYGRLVNPLLNRYRDLGTDRHRLNEWFNAVGEMTGLFSRSDTAGVAEKADQGRHAENLTKPFFTPGRVRATIFFTLLFGGILAFGVYTVFFYGV